jgi:hypothetical protein
LPKNQYLYASTIILTLTLIIANTNLTSAIVPTLVLTLETDKTTYNVGETVQINGALYYDWGGNLNPIPVEDIVALQINYPSTYGLYLLRTLSTGSLQYKTWDVEILQLTPCDESGNPKSSFKRGTIAHFKIEWKNNDNTAHYTRIIFALYYANNQPFATFAPISGTLDPNRTEMAIIPVPISSDAVTGPAKIYASAISDWIAQNGYPYCPEKSAEFTITSSTGSVIPSTSTKTATTYQSQTTTDTVSTVYNLNITIPTTGAYIGDYSIYVSSRLLGERQATNTTTFKVILLGDINGDLAVTIADYQLLKKAIPSTPGNPNWNPKADLNGDNKVDIKDYAIIKQNVGHYART